MKKILINILIFFSVFVVVDKVSADTNETLTFSSTELEEKLTYISQNTKPGYAVRPYGSSTLNILNNTFIAEKGYEEYGQYYACVSPGTGSYPTAYCFISDSPNLVKATYIRSSDNTYKGLSLNFNFDLEDLYVYIVSNGTVSSNSKYYKDFTGLNKYYLTTNHSYSLGDSSYDIEDIYFPTNVPYIEFEGTGTLVTSVTTTDNYIFNDGDVIFYLNDNEFKTNREHKKAQELLTLYKFNKNVDDYNYSKMIFNLNQDEIKSNNYNFDMEYKIETVGEIDEQGNLVSSDSIDFLEPYIEYTLDNRKKYLYLSNSEASHNNPSSLWELASCPALPSGATEVKLIIPMESTKNVRYKVYLKSAVSFYVSYEYDEEVVDYYETIDLGDKYGVMFMPKIVANNYSSVYAIFEFGGIESISIYETYDLNQAPIEIYDDLDTYISFRIDNELVNYNVFFKSEQKPLQSLVKYDTRYFTYHIVDSKYSVGIVENPNTGESTFVDFGNTGSTQVSFTDISSVFKYISEQLSDNNEAYILFSNSVRTFFATMPSDVLILVMTITAVLFLGIALALGGWK